MLSVAVHEVGHVLGLEHAHGAEGVMGERLATGVRELPTSHDVHHDLYSDDTRPGTLPMAMPPVDGWRSSDPSADLRDAVLLSLVDPDLVRRQSVAQRSGDVPEYRVLSRIERRQAIDQALADDSWLEILPGDDFELDGLPGEFEHPLRARSPREGQP